MSRTYIVLPVIAYPPTKKKPAKDDDLLDENGNPTKNPKWWEEIGVSKPIDIEDEGNDYGDDEISDDTYEDYMRTTVVDHVFIDLSNVKGFSQHKFPECCFVHFYNPLFGQYQAPVKIPHRFIVSYLKGVGADVFHLETYNGN